MTGSAESTKADVLQREAERCAAMMAGDFDRLREILHPELTHVHAKGQLDDYDSYFAGGGTRVTYREVSRSDLTVRLAGDAAVMTGRQRLVAVRKDGSGTVTIDSRVLQVWVRASGGWRQLAFQTTPLAMRVE